MTLLHDLDKSLAELSPQATGTYVFALVDALPLGLEPFATVREDEGLTVVVTEKEAADRGLKGSCPMTRISLLAYTSLEAVGITATVAQTLASRSIACNVIAGYHHDYLFVPKDKADEAIRLLEGLATHARGWLPK